MSGKGKERWGQKSVNITTRINSALAEVGNSLSALAQLDANRAAVRKGNRESAKQNWGSGGNEPPPQPQAGPSQPRQPQPSENEPEVVVMESERVQSTFARGDLEDDIGDAKSNWLARAQEQAPKKRFEGDAFGVKRSLRESNFMITLQTNYKPRNKTEGREVQNAFVGALQRVFNDETELSKMLLFGVFPDKNPPKGVNFGNDNYEDHVESVTSNVGVEYGPKTRRLHAHVLLTVKHYSRIFFDRQTAANRIVELMRGHSAKMGKFYSDEWWGPEYAEDGQKLVMRSRRMKPGRSQDRSLYVQVKLLPQTNLQDLLKLYISKTVRAYNAGDIKNVNN